ncbi:PREDICTED: uncharacterized protein LOC106314372 [Brassica oleracea var. oleracea]|uniref:uncharacterized protein LOC106314372 n=1 Tax=Brassica oleracea var. oleracea TaxID=109376 RepID=UPI0006A6FEE1|nr:PREDICTED: uncharacterized protein LOC106314372 [Brassica oleracea var. oleracea]
MREDWYHHGEVMSGTDSRSNGSEKRNEILGLYQAAAFVDEEFLRHGDLSEVAEGEDKAEDEFLAKLADAETPLYPSCANHSKLSAIVSLFRIKTQSGWSDRSFDLLLETLPQMLPEDNVLHTSLYEVKRFLRSFDMGYETIHACVNDCCLFRKEFEKLDKCPKCNASRWKINLRTGDVKKGIPQKVLRYFLIIPRLKRMFRSEDMSKDLRWHFTNKSTDGKSRHPVDSVTCNQMNDRYPSFVAQERNLRLGLSTDGFNPFNMKNVNYSCWPVLLVIYNMSPEKCMKEENIMLSLLIPGPSQPGNNIDVYLEPLIEDLNHLWEKGESTYDAVSHTTFTLRAMLLWTIQDFPAYGNLAGCKVKGKMGCPDLPVRHNLDVMHVERNVAASLIATLLHCGKSKDGLNARKDLELLGIRKDLHPQPRGKRTYLPPAPWCVKLEESKISGLKSHDYHVLMQQLLPVAIRGLLPKGVRIAIGRLCAFFHHLCQRVIDVEKITVLETEIVETLCMFERFFPPSFFDIMMHLVVHLAREARLCGPVHFRWMYPFERYMKVLKDFVRNLARPEGCIAEAYLAEECVRFCSQFLKKNNKL